MVAVSAIYDNLVLEVTKLLAFIEDANSNRTAYKYDTRQRVTNVYLDADEDGVLDTTEASVEYLYAQNRLSGITTAKTAYTLTYDVFGNLLSIKAGDNTLATYTYTAGNGKLTKLTYGNGDYEQFTYDHLDRLVKVVYNGNASSGYELFYDANGRLYKTVDYEAGLTHLYEYDSLNRLIFAWQKNSSGSIVLEVQNAYDELGRAKGSTYVIGDTTQTYGIAYEDITGLVKNYTTPGNSFSYTYDVFDRMTDKSGSRHAIAYTYVAGTQRVATYNITQADASNITYSYTYDALGNITSIKKNGTAVSVYEYDSLGRLIRENDCANSTAWVYTYDNAGNLLKKYTFYGLADNVPASHLLSIHPYNGSEISSTYTYSSSAWGDLLTGYNGTSISYDAIGNPTNWRNATGMDWHQRSLTSMSVSGTSVYYTYNADGIRTQKTVGTSGHIYVLDGSTILKETIYTAGTVANTLYYYYDESGISGVSYNGTKYSYIKNLQGDVIRIINSNGATVVEYKYDAWGNILSVTGSLASTLGATNPFRYRGYYCDTESGWYYLNSRYYDPQVGRFLNADSYVSTGQSISSYNMFAYCLNNPVARKDTAGTKSVCVITMDSGNPLNDLGGIPFGGGCAGGAGSSGLGGCGGSSEGSIEKLCEDISNFDLFNDDPQKVIEANYFSWYRGTLVIITPFDASFSFGFIGLSTHQRDVNVLKHEYGHTLQLKNKGLVRYTYEVAMPSIMINLLHRQGKLTYDYYSYPWEAEANELGGSTLSEGKPPLPQGEAPSDWDLIRLFFE